jgi:hypothetical protein
VNGRNCAFKTILQRGWIEVEVHHHLLAGGPGASIRRREW